jgi:hypothetical protein
MVLATANYPTKHDRTVMAQVPNPRWLNLHTPFPSSCLQLRPMAWSRVFALRLELHNRHATHHTHREVNSSSNCKSHNYIPNIIPLGTPHQKCKYPCSNSFHLAHDRADARDRPASEISPVRGLLELDFRVTFKMNAHRCKSTSLAHPTELGRMTGSVLGTKSASCFVKASPMTR